MINLVLLSLLLYAVVLFAGFGLLQLVNRQRVNLWETLPFAWGVGVSLLYLLGYLFIKGELLITHWHYFTLLVLLLVGVAGMVRYKRAPLLELTAVPESALQTPWRRIASILLLALLLIKVLTVIASALLMPVIDSDATNPAGYMTIAEKILLHIPLSQALAASDGYMRSQLGPSLLTAWGQLFVERWHISLAALPWILTYLFSGLLIYQMARKWTQSPLMVLGLTYVFVSLPLLTVHVIRIGFNDIFVMYFLLSGVMTLYHLYLQQPTKKDGLAWSVASLLIFSAALGMTLSKLEGVVWAGWLVVIYLSITAHTLLGVRWKPLLALQVGIAAVLLAIYYGIDPAFYDTLEQGRLNLLKPHAPELTAIAYTVKTLFTMGSFNLYWWLFVIFVLYGLFSQPLEMRVFIFYMLSIFMSLMFFANLTANVTYTANGTSTGRFLLQISPIAIPIFIQTIRLLSEKEGLR
ncbi:MAG: hypothetical protein HQL49_10000 [Gammaproteobacteria bacterium]|nr:hypothetical protein [Gammaproteobacteria bacterium]